jgi:hypothetical protein
MKKFRKHDFISSGQQPLNKLCLWFLAPNQQQSENSVSPASIVEESVLR